MGAVSPTPATSVAPSARDMAQPPANDLAACTTPIGPTALLEVLCPDNLRANYPVCFGTVEDGI